MNNLPEDEYIHIKVRIGNLISPDVFPTGRIRDKDIPTFNKKLDEVINYIEFVIKEQFNPSTQAVASQQSANKDFTAQSVSPKFSPEGFCYQCQEADGNYLCDKQDCDCKCHQGKTS